MSESLPLALAWLAGLLLGAVFFGGLWWTVRAGLSSGQPAFWFLASMLLRTGFVLAGFFLVANHGLGKLLLCLLGFVMARLVVTQVTQPRQTQETRHAP
jgi:F1F0 ATPase subunit 2